MGFRVLLVGTTMRTTTATTTTSQLNVWTRRWSRVPLSVGSDLWWRGNEKRKKKNKTNERGEKNVLQVVTTARRYKPGDLQPPGEISVKWMKKVAVPCSHSRRYDFSHRGRTRLNRRMQSIRGGSRHSRRWEKKRRRKIKWGMNEE